MAHRLFGFLINTLEYSKLQKDAVQRKLYTKQKLYLWERNKRNDSFRMRKKTYLSVPIKLAQHEIQLAFIKPEGLKELPRIPSINQKKNKLAVWFDYLFLLEGKISLSLLPEVSGEAS